MRLLITTQKVDQGGDSLGFFHGWIEKLAERVEQIHVVCLWKGKHSLPENVRVYSLGKEKIYNRNYPHFLRRLYYIFNLYRIVLPLLFKIDLVFLHMNPQYIFFLWPFLKIFRKPTLLWKCRRYLPLLSKISVPFLDKIVTATSQTFPVASRKVVPIGHGIDTEFFKPSSNNSFSKTKKILAMGRISPSKNYQALIEAVNILVNQKKFKDIEIRIVGDASAPSQKRYLEFLEEKVKSYGLEDYVHFLGPVPYTETVNHYRECDLFCNFCNVTGLDKTLLEAMACGKIICTDQDTLAPFLGSYKEKLMTSARNSQQTAAKIQELLSLDQEIKQKIGEDLRKIVVENHSLDDFIKKLITEFQKLL